MTPTPYAHRPQMVLAGGLDRPAEWRTRSTSTPTIAPADPGAALAVEALADLLVASVIFADRLTQQVGLPDPADGGAAFARRAMAGWTRNLADSGLAADGRAYGVDVTAGEQAGQAQRVVYAAAERRAENRLTWENHLAAYARWFRQEMLWAAWAAEQLSEESI